jgi:hypothetical protein
MRRLRFIVALLALDSVVPMGSLIAAETDAALPWTAEQIAFFEAKIRPVLVEHCYKCHSSSAEHVKGGLMLDSRDGMRQGGDSGRAIVPGESDQSLLIEALRYESYEMPPSGRLSEKIIADFVKWVDMGAPDPRDVPRDATPSNKPSASDVSASNDSASQGIDWDAARDFWAFERPRKHTAGRAFDPWVQRPIDGFILDRLADEGLRPSPAADRRTLIRRVTFDLIGLPATPEEVEAFLADESPAAYERLVDRLLASPHYGERWAQLWLDIMRYAEDQAHIVGDDTSLFYPNAYLYREWVIGALNDDMPYDEFIRLQLAADLTHPDDAALHVATGFIGLGPKYYRRRSPEVQAEEWENQIDTLTRGMLGLTVACARCHDHKYDPIPTVDYYAIAGVFAGTELFNRPLTAEVEIDKDNEAKKPEDAAHIVRDSRPRDLNVMIRGDVTNTGPVVPRRFLRVLCEGEPSGFSHGDSGRRELADAIASPENPLTARVIVNRIWGAHFGRHLVGTPSNFGFLGERPTHPDLLDDLAVRFMEHGWPLKWLHREIVLSATYRQTSSPRNSEHSSASADVNEDTPAGPLRSATADPANRLLSRMNRKRLSIEQWRDAILAVSGRLDRHIGGRSIIPSESEARRRTVYAVRSRYELNKMLALFDFPDANIHAARRTETTTPLQKMFVLNSPFMAAQAKALAERVTAEEPASAEKRIHRLYKLLYSRPPLENEVNVAMEFLDDADADRWIEYAHVLLAANEVLVID